MAIGVLIEVLLGGPKVSTNKSGNSSVVVMEKVVRVGKKQVRIGNLINQSATSCAISIPPLL